MFLFAQMNAMRHWWAKQKKYFKTTISTTCAAINTLPRSKVENMIVTFRKPVEGVRGKIRLEDGFYIRKLHGKYVVQRCPNRKGHVATEKERENQQRFIQLYRRVRRGDGSHASGSVADGRGNGLEVKGKEV